MSELASFHREENNKEFETLEREIEETGYKDDILQSYTYEGPKMRKSLKWEE